MTPICSGAQSRVVICGRENRQRKRTNSRYTDVEKRIQQESYRGDFSRCAVHTVSLSPGQDVVKLQNTACISDLTPDDGMSGTDGDVF